MKLDGASTCLDLPLVIWDCPKLRVEAEIEEAPKQDEIDAFRQNCASVEPPLRTLPACVFNRYDEHGPKFDTGRISPLPREP